MIKSYSRLSYSIIAITAFLLCSYLTDLLQLVGVLSEPMSRAAFLSVRLLSYIVLPLAVFMLLFGFKSGLKESGLIENPFIAFVVAVVATSPMWLGFWILSDGSFAWSWGDLFHGAVVPGVSEELLFRSLLFGLLLRHAKWHFLPAAGLCAVFFGAAHLYQSGSAMSALMIFGITFIGSTWFSWLFLRWRFNLWVPIMMHLLMNAWWSVFSVDTSAMGDISANLLRLATIVLSVILTIIWNKRLGQAQADPSVLVEPYPAKQ